MSTQERKSLLTLFIRMWTPEREFTYSLHQDVNTRKKVFICSLRQDVSTRKRVFTFSLRQDGNTRKKEFTYYSLYQVNSIFFLTWWRLGTLSKFYCNDYTHLTRSHYVAWYNCTEWNWQTIEKHTTLMPKYFSLSHRSLKHSGELWYSTYQAYHATTSWCVPELSVKSGGDHRYSIRCFIFSRVSSSRSQHRCWNWL